MSRIILISALFLAYFAATGNSQCAEKNGRFPVAGQCDAYIECINGVAEEKTCPDGLLFKESDNPFAYPCHYPIDVECGARSKLRSAEPTDECPHQFGYFKIGDANNCGQFKNCVNGQAFTFDCPDSLAFNPATYLCEWPDQVESCNAEAFLNFKCPQVAKSELLGEPEQHFYRSNNNCQHYYLCIDGKPRQHACGEGRAFNEDIQSCDDIENVLSCGAKAASFKSG